MSAGNLAGGSARRGPRSSYHRMTRLLERTVLREPEASAFLRYRLSLSRRRSLSSPPLWSRPITPVRIPSSHPGPSFLPKLSDLFVDGQSDELSSRQSRFKDGVDARARAPGVVAVPLSSLLPAPSRGDGQGARPLRRSPPTWSAIGSKGRLFFRVGQTRFGLQSMVP